MSNIIAAPGFKARWAERLKRHNRNLTEVYDGILQLPPDLPPPTEEFSETMRALLPIGFSGTGRDNVMARTIAAIGQAEATRLGVDPRHIAPYLYAIGLEVYPSYPHSPTIRIGDFNLGAWVWTAAFPLQIPVEMTSSLPGNFRTRMEGPGESRFGHVMLGTGQNLMLSLEQASLQDLPGLEGGLNIIHPRAAALLRSPATPTDFHVPYFQEWSINGGYSPIVRLATPTEIDEHFASIPDNSWLRTNAIDALNYFSNLELANDYEDVLLTAGDDAPIRSAPVRTGPVVPTSGVSRPERPVPETATQRAMRRQMDAQINRMGRTATRTPAPIPRPTTPEDNQVRELDELARMNIEAAQPPRDQMGWTIPIGNAANAASRQSSTITFGGILPAPW